MSQRRGPGLDALDRFGAARLSELVARAGQGAVALTGVAPGAVPFAAALLARALGRPVALVLPTRDEADRVFLDLGFYAERLGADAPLRTAFLPALEPEPYLGISPHLGVALERSQTLHRLLTHSVDILLVPADALLGRLPPPAVFLSAVSRVELGDRIDRDGFLKRLVSAGYRRQDLVGTAGEFAVRGGIVDIFSPGLARPVRLELLGDEIESLRTFDPVTQRSDEEILEADVLPLREFPVDASAYPTFAAWCDRQGEAASADAVRKLRGELKEQGSFHGIEHWAPAFIGELADLSAYLEGFSLVVSEPELVTGAAEKVYAALEERYAELLARPAVAPAPAELALPPERFAALLAGRTTVELRALAEGVELERTLPLHAQPSRRYDGRIKDLAQDLARDRDAGFLSIVVVPSEPEADRVEAMLSEYEISYLEGDAARGVLTDERANKGTVAVALGRLTTGFRSPDLKLSLLAAPEVFGGVAAPVRRRRRGGAGTPFASDFRDLKVGDPVVHVDHGIGRFLGLKALESAGLTQDYMVLAYAGEDKLYVPLERLELVQKYSGLEAAKPKVDALGGASWARVKTRVKKEIREMTGELLNLYAARRVMPGHAYAPAGLLQREFDEACGFDLTDDQRVAVSDVMGDMESTRCTDRLVVGDVGFGKTEVAMRAAFRAVADNKQVAVLTPTTVLAFQHFNTLKERFKAFPATIDLLSRFRTPEEQKATLKLLADGKVDIVVGTHRLLSKDVHFRDLGLLIVDEEQRFGVGHKERIKQMKRGIEVLTLTATPIPRTLQMALSGLRDMSTIATPPPNRLAIETNVVRWDSRVIHDAILHEIERGGQVYFIHNRVESIYAMSDALRSIAPFARLGVGHGQMADKELEDVMFRFLDRQFDVLVATTIVENGLDLPNVNTIIVNRAHRFGLAQLYQLRGRVGRSDRPAYAYLLIPPKIELTPLARRRLHAIQEFSELGSGFRLAALDLELRGAGNVLGGQQHGHIAAIGFDLYVQMLEETVRELSGKPPELITSTQISLGIDLHVPDDYISETNQRLVVYKKIASASAVAELDDLQREIRDRFGEPPAAVLNLLEQARLKVDAQDLNVESVERKAGLGVIRFGQNVRFDPEAVVAWAELGGGRRFHPDGRLELPLPAGPDAIPILRRTLAEVSA